MSSKENNFKEQFKQALISTAKVISEDYKLDVKKLDKNLSNKKTDFFDITNLLFNISPVLEKAKILFTFSYFEYSKHKAFPIAPELPKIAMLIVFMIILKLARDKID